MNSKITRRTFVGALSLAPALRANGLGGMLWDYNLEYMRLLDQRRSKRYDEIQSIDQLEELRKDVRKRLATTWGPFPAERTPLNARETGRIERDDYLIEKVVFESRPNFYVTANLYRPKHVDGKLPAIVVSCGHMDDGKAGETYQRFCILAARHGFVAMIYDPVSQGERMQLWDASKQQSRIGPGTGEHRALGNQCYLVGLNLMNYRVWDAARVIDYLETRDDVDAGRIAMAGNSGGGMTTLQYACFDPRVQAAFVGCAVASFPGKTRALLIADPEQILVDTLRFGVDHTELLAAFAPKPLVIGSALRDFVPITAARETYRQVQHAYRLHDAESKLLHAETDDTHGWNEDLRKAAVDWFSRWLSNTSREVVETEATVSTPEELRCTSTGQVADSLESKTVVDLNRERFAEIEPRRPVPTNESDFTLFKNVIQHKVNEVTRVGAFRPERGILIPDRVIDNGSASRDTVVVIADKGKDDPQVRREVIDPLISAGYRVVALDLRGWGETTPTAEGRKVSFAWEDFFAYRGLEIGKPLIGQRMKDFAAVAASRTRRQRWSAVGVGAGGLVAATLAVIDPRIERLATVNTPLSYRSIFEDLSTTQPFSSYLPGVLGAYEIRELYAAAAPRRLLVLNPQNSQGGAVETVSAWSEYDWISQVYEGLNAHDRFQVVSELDAAGLRSAIMTWFG